MAELTTHDFVRFFRELHGFDPFPWQRRLAEQVTSGPWPDALALPTGSGKTACLDIAVFSLACQVSRPPGERTSPRRIFFVIDRRVVVDEAFQAATRLSKALASAKDGILAVVADHLRALGGDEMPLACFQLRGGIYRDDAWARTPAQPTIVVSTVDQIGSRLLYRGYGTSAFIRPIHAGLAGNDALLLVDEAHCSVPFSETAQSVARYRTWADGPLLSPFQVVLMSATPPAGVVALTTSGEDHSHAVLGLRLRAAKPASLTVAKQARGPDALEALAEVLAEEAVALSARPGVRSVAVIANRVFTARRVYQWLREREDTDSILLTGRMRPLDRDDVMRTWGPRLAASAEREPLDRPIFVVATQCLEVGANLDFDALVTECASLDALRQRFGRVNRLGLRPKAPAAIVIRADQKRDSADDPVYGDALASTWRFLEEHAEDGVFDMGIAALEAVLVATDPEVLDGLRAPVAHAPIMLPAHADCWAQTAPEPLPSPDVAHFLHGPARGSPEVSVVWRADLDPDQPDEAQWIAAVSMCPPTAAEAMPVPLSALRAWMTDDESALRDLHDVEGGQTSQPPGDEPEGPMRLLRWRGPEDSALIESHRQLRPGDTVVIPSRLGGWNDLGHIPGVEDHGAVDIAERAQLISKGRAVLRLHPLVLQAWSSNGLPSEIVEVATSSEPADNRDELAAGLGALADSPGVVPWIREIAAALARDRRLQVLANPSGGFVLRGSTRIAAGATGGDFTDEDSSSSATVEVRLSEHSISVREKAESFARASQLPPEVCEDLARAGWLHDLGKADPRFQVWLHGGNELAAAKASAPLAKSGTLPSSSMALRAARRRSGYPEGGRHELLSVRLAQSDPAILEKAHDRDLVLHLVESHHGRCRPFAPVVQDAHPLNVRYDLAGHVLRANSATGLERIDSGVADRFWSLVRRYGWWGLAQLEAILRLADHRVSEGEVARAMRGTR